MEVIISQVFVAISYIFIGISYITKKRNMVLICSIMSVISFAVAYFLLNAWSALAMMAVSMTRNIIFLIRSKSQNPNKLDKVDYIIGSILLIAIICLSVVTYEEWYSLLSCIATLIYTFSVWQKNTMVYKICGVPTSLFWIVYNVFINSILGIILESLIVVFAILGLCLDLYKNTKKSQLNTQENKELA